MYRCARGFGSKGGKGGGRWVGGTSETLQRRDGHRAAAHDGALYCTSVCTGQRLRKPVDSPGRYTSLAPAPATAAATTTAHARRRTAQHSHMHKAIGAPRVFKGFLARCVHAYGLRPIHEFLHICDIPTMWSQSSVRSRPQTEHPAARRYTNRRSAHSTHATVASHPKAEMLDDS